MSAALLPRLYHRSLMMFFDNLDQIPEIALGTGCSVFVINQLDDKNFEGAFFLSPVDKPSITVEQVRDFTAQFNTKQSKDIFAVITPADAMSTAAQNAFLKNLEEPAPYIHYVLLTNKPTKLLPTILSRAQVFYHKKIDSLDADLAVDAEIRNLAKQFITAKPTELPALADTIAKQKNSREYSLEVIAIAVELLYKSYFKTKNPAFLEKIPKFTELYDNLAMNGHIKLHLVADLC